MELLNTTFIFSAFFAGMLIFFAPCTLPLVPAYLGFISGVSQKDMANKETRHLVRRTVLMHSIYFVLGFSAVFIVFGALAGFLGSALVAYQTWLARVGGALIIIFGLFMLGVFNISFLQATHKLAFPKSLRVGKPISSFVIGGTFALGWTPCIGPILGAILTLAANGAAVWQGAFLLAIFSLGLALPFLFVALAFGAAAQYIKKISFMLRAISFIGGVFLILLGLMLLSNNINFVIQYVYSFFNYLHYDGLLEYL